MTAHNRPDRVAGSLREQAAAYLSKPFTKGALLDVLSTAIRWEMQPDDIEVLSDKPNWITVRARCTVEAAGRQPHPVLHRNADAVEPGAARDGLGRLQRIADECD